MNERDEWREDLLELEAKATEYLIAAKTRTLTDEEILTCATAMGTVNEIYRELRK